jgi:hypothetical protein
VWVFDPRPEGRGYSSRVSSEFNIVEVIKMEKLPNFCAKKLDKKLTDYILVLNGQFYFQE